MLPASPTSAFCKFVPAGGGGGSGTAEQSELARAAPAPVMQDGSGPAAQQALRQRPLITGPQLLLYNSVTLLAAAFPELLVSVTSHVKRTYGYIKVEQMIVGNNLCR